MLGMNKQRNRISISYSLVKQFDFKIRTEISSLAAEYSIEKDVIISPIIKDIHIWKKNQKYHTLFYSEIIRDGIRLC